MQYKQFNIDRSKTWDKFKVRKKKKKQARVQVIGKQYNAAEKKEHKNLDSN